MENILPWITAHWADVLAIIGGVQLVAVTISRLTPSTRDDTVVASVFGWVDKIGGILSIKPKA